MTAVKLRVDVTLKDGVLDPAGKAVAHALHGMGFANVNDVRIGKMIELDVTAASPAEAEQQAKAMAEALLANMVIENFNVKVMS